MEILKILLFVDHNYNMKNKLTVELLLSSGI